MINTDLENALEVMIGSQEVEAIYVGSNFIWLKNILPYDAEVLYLESTGTQYIDLNIIPDGNTGICILSIHVNNTSDEYAVGLRNSTGDTRWCIGHTPNRWYGGYGITKHTDNNQNIISDLAEIKLNYLNSAKLEVTNLVSDAYFSSNLSSLSFTPSSVIRIFGASGLSSDYNYTKWSGKIYMVQVTQGNQVILDLIPVRIGLTGYMYDKISGDLFGNDGTGSFTLGADKTSS